MQLGQIPQCLLTFIIMCSFSLAVAAQEPGSVAPVTSPTVQKLQILDIVRKPANQLGRAPTIIKDPVEMPHYVFNNSIYPPIKNFAPTGYMGDIGDTLLLGSYKIIFQEGYPCLKVKYLGKGGNGWSGIMWQNPPNNWGDLNGGYNLSGAQKFAFWGRGDTGGEIVEFKLGGTLGHYPDSDNISSGNVTLTTEWKEYVFDLTESDIFNISAGFGIIFSKANNPNGVIIYLDNIRFE